MKWTLLIYTIGVGNPAVPAHKIPGWSSRDYCELAANELMNKYASSSKPVAAVCQLDIPFVLPTPR